MIRLATALCLVTEEQIDLVITQALDTACQRVLSEPDLIRKLLRHRMRNRPKQASEILYVSATRRYGPLVSI